MQSESTASAIGEIKRVGPETLPQYVELWNRFWPDLSISTELMEYDDRELPEPHRERRYMAWQDGRPIAYAYTQTQLGAPDGNWHLSVGVSEDCRNKGLGSLLLKTIEEEMQARKVTKSFTQVRESDSATLAFANSRGFFEERRDFFSVLDIQAFDKPMGQPTGIEFATAAQLDSDAFRRAFHAVFEEIRLDVPRATEPEPFTFDDFQTIFFGDPNLLPDGTMVATHNGEFVGFSVAFNNARDGFIDQGLTGVKRTHRGRGIAQALKTRLIHWAKNQGHRQIQADNDSRNAAMLAVNESLGFVRQEALIYMGKSYS